MKASFLKRLADFGCLFWDASRVCIWIQAPSFQLHSALQTDIPHVFAYPISPNKGTHLVLRRKNEEKTMFPFNTTVENQFPHLRRTPNFLLLIFRKKGVHGTWINTVIGEQELMLDHVLACAWRMGSSHCCVPRQDNRPLAHGIAPPSSYPQPSPNKQQWEVVYEV